MNWIKYPFSQNKLLSPIILIFDVSISCISLVKEKESKFMVHTLDGNSEHVAHTWRKKDDLAKTIWFVTSLGLIKRQLHRSDQRYCSLRVRLFLSYLLIYQYHEIIRILIMVLKLDGIGIVTCTCKLWNHSDLYHSHNCYKST